MKSCPVCGDLIPSGGLGRPPTYCSMDCRREMTARHRVVARMEAELDDARQRLRDERWRPGREHYWTSTIRLIEVQLAEARRAAGAATVPSITVV